MMFFNAATRKCSIANVTWAGSPLGHATLGRVMASTPSFGFLRAPDSSPYKPSGEYTYCQLWSPSSPSTLPGLSFLGCPRPATGTLSPSQARSIAVIPRLPHFQLLHLVYHKVHNPSPAHIQIFSLDGKASVHQGFASPMSPSRARD